MRVDVPLKYNKAFVQLLLYVLLFPGIAGLLNAQSLELIRSTKIENCIHIEMDHLYNIYTIHKNGEIKKWGAEGKALERNNNIRLGTLGQLDTEDPLKLLAWYPDYNTVMTLDKRLNEQSRADLSKANIFQCQGICHSNDDHLWIYDPNTFQLKKLSMDLKVTESSPDLIQILGFTPAPFLIREEGNSVYLMDSTNGILVFDAFAQYVKRIPLTGIQDAALQGDQLYYYKEHLYIYNLSTLQESILYDGPIEGFVQFIVKGKRLLIFRKNHLDLYQILF